MNTLQVAFAGVVRMIELAATVATNEAARVVEDTRFKAVREEKRRQKGATLGRTAKRAANRVSHA